MSLINNFRNQKIIKYVSYKQFQKPLNEIAQRKTNR